MLPTKKVEHFADISFIKLLRSIRMFFYFTNTICHFVRQIKRTILFYLMRNCEVNIAVHSSSACLIHITIGTDFVNYIDLIIKCLINRKVYL